MESTEMLVPGRLAVFDGHMSRSTCHEADTHFSVCSASYDCWNIFRLKKITVLPERLVLFHIMGPNWGSRWNPQYLSAVMYGWFHGIFQLDYLVPLANLSSSCTSVHRIFLYFYGKTFWFNIVVLRLCILAFLFELITLNYSLVSMYFVSSCDALHTREWVSGFCQVELDMIFLENFHSALEANEMLVPGRLAVFDVNVPFNLPWSRDSISGSVAHHRLDTVTSRFGWYYHNSYFTLVLQRK